MTPQDVYFHTAMTFFPGVTTSLNFSSGHCVGAWDGAEVSELCGIYILERLTNSEGPFEKSTVRLYRDDGLGVARGTDRTRNKIREQIEKIFHELGFKIETVINKIEVDFLDVKLNLETYKHRPYRKPGDTPR